jgi:hypothetical protein
LTKQFSRVLLKAIVNGGDYDKVKSFIDTVSDLLMVKDYANPELQRKRLEWIFGFGFLKLS